jgi:hypothetical protein
VESTAASTRVCPPTDLWHRNGLGAAAACGLMPTRAPVPEPGRGGRAPPLNRRRGGR